MQRIDLVLRQHSHKMGEACGVLQPTTTESCMLVLDGRVIGAYLADLGDSRLSKLLAIANAEFNSNRVTKTEMARRPTDGWDEEKKKWKYKNKVLQQSALLGSIPPKPHQQRPYPTKSSVHLQKKAGVFIQAMQQCCEESENLLREVMPDQYSAQKKLIEEYAVPKWRFGNLFTSSISNYNISANYHQDRANIVGSVNIILTKRAGANGGCLHVPDYGAVFAQQDNSMLIYPAWANMHGVTPIEPYQTGGYRNSFIFYALASFKNWQ